MDDRDIARWRLHTLRLAGTPYPSASAAVDGMLAVQAENYPHTLWALATRTAGVRRVELQQLFDDGVILRTHVLRPTWHFVSARDIRWLVELTAPRVRRSLAQLARALDVADATLGASIEVIGDALSDGTHRTRESLAERLGDAGIDPRGQRLGLMLMNAELSGVICSGRMEGNRHTYALLAQRSPAARRLEREEALAELVLRYFGGHGPATERDLAYWATLTLAEVRAGLRTVADRLDNVEHDGRRYWYGEPPPDGDALEPRAHLLLSLDEYHNGYQDSRYVLDADGHVPRGRRPNVGMALVDGQMVGGVRRTVDDDTVTFEVDTFRTLRDEEVAALHEAAERCRRFLGVAHVDVVTV